MAELWGIPDIRHWWLPNEEGYLPIIRSIRSFIEERTLKPGNQPQTEDLRNMKAIFSKLSINDNEKPKPDGSGSPGGESTHEGQAAKTGG